VPCTLGCQRGERSASRYPDERAGAERAFINAFAALSRRLDDEIAQGDAEWAFGVISRHQRNMNRAFAAALAVAEWDLASDIAQPLDEFWDDRGQYEEARGWVTRVRDAVEGRHGEPPDLDTDESVLWLYLMGSQADRDQSAGKTAEAEATYLGIIAALDRQPPSETTSHRLPSAWA